jgi:hypothetical protein
MRRSILGLPVLAASAALAVAAQPASAQEEWAGRGDYGWGGFGGYARGVLAGQSFGSPPQERVGLDGNAPYRAYNSWNGYRRFDYDGAYSYGYFGCGFCGYPAAYLRYGGYWVRPSDHWGYGWGGYGDGYRHDYRGGSGYGWRHYDCEPRYVGYGQRASC